MCLQTKPCRDICGYTDPEQMSAVNGICVQTKLHCWKDTRRLSPCIVTFPWKLVADFLIGKFSWLCGFESFIALFISHHLLCFFSHIIYYERVKNLLMRSISMKLCMYIITPNPVATVYFINPFHQSVLLYFTSYHC